MTAEKSKSFRERVLAEVRKIPSGSTRTYKEVAALSGNPRAARAVGAILKTNFDSDIPCHRVVKSDTSLGGYNRGVALKKKLLLAERVSAQSPEQYLNP